MHAPGFDRRSSGIPELGELAWGSDLCQFYETKEDLLDLIVPYFRAGLEGNELCLWSVPEPLTVDEAARALEERLPGFRERVARGQIEARPAALWPSTPEETQRQIVSRLDAAILEGFDGLRLACPAVADAADGRLPAPPGMEALGTLNVLVLFQCPRGRVGAAALMEAARDHRYTLVRNAGRWEVLEGSEVRSVRDALARSQAELRSLFANMTEGFAYHRIVLDAGGKPCDYVFLEVNEAFSRLTGLAPERILGRRVTEVLPGIERDETDWIGRYGRVALTQEPTQFESRSAALDTWYSVSAFSPHKGFFAVTFTDITPRKRAEAALAHEKERLDVTLRSIGDGVIAADTSGAVVLMNRVAEHMTGWSQKEAVGRPMTEVFRIVNAATRLPCENPVARVIASGQVVGLANHTILIARDGTERILSDSAAPIRDASGQVVGVVLVFQDATEKHRADMERETTIEFLRLVNAAAGLRDLVRSVATFFQKQSGCEAVGIRLHEGDSYPYFEARGFPESFIEEDSLLCAGEQPGRVARGDAAHPAEACMCGNVTAGRFDPRRPYFTPHGTFWTNSSSELLASTTEADRLAWTHNRCSGDGYESVALLPLRLGAERLGLVQLNDRRKGRFLPEVIGAWERLADHLAIALANLRAEEKLRSWAETLEERVAERTAEAERRASQLRLLASQVMQAERKERERLAAVLHDHLQQLLVAAKYHNASLERTPDESVRAVAARTAELLDQAIDDSRSLTAELSPRILHESGLVAGLGWLARRMREQHGLAVELAVDGDVEPATADVRLFLFEAIRELLFNVVKHAGILTARLALDRSDGQVRVCVEDSGVGMSPQAGRDRPDRSPGFGLFSIQQRLELIGGRMAIEGAPGSGTRVTLLAPVEPVAAPAEAVAAKPAARDAGRPATPRSARTASGRIRVVLADDHAVMREGLARLLGQEPDMEVVGQAADGREAVQLAARLRPDVILMDVSMPNLNGVEATRAIHGDYPGVRIIGLSMFDEAERAQALRDAGAVGYLAKSGPATGLLAAIRGDAETRPRSSAARTKAAPRSGSAARRPARPRSTRRRG